MYKLTPEEVARIVAEEDALATLRSYSVEEIWTQLDAPEEAEDEAEAFTKLMGVMYALRPVGHL